MSNEFAEIYFALSKREMQVIEIIFQLGKVSARDIQAKLPVRLADSTIRTTLSSLIRKGAVSAEFIGKKLIYSLSFKKQAAGDIVLRKFVNIYHNGSYAKTIKQVFEMYASSLTDAECNEISARFMFETGKRLKSSS